MSDADTEMRQCRSYILESATTSNDYYPISSLVLKRAITPADPTIWWSPFSQQV